MDTTNQKRPLDLLGYGYDQDTLPKLAGLWTWPTRRMLYN